MLDHKKLHEITKKLMDTLPKGVCDLSADLEKNFHSILQSAFAKLDLVTREEFDAQVGVLQRTRKKLDALEKQLKAMPPSPPKTKAATHPKARQSKQ